jgi:hypothetical protein
MRRTVSYLFRVGDVRRRDVMTDDLRTVYVQSIVWR